MEDEDTGAVVDGEPLVPDVDDAVVLDVDEVVEAGEPPFDDEQATDQPPVAPTKMQVRARTPVDLNAWRIVLVSFTWNGNASAGRRAKRRTGRAPLRLHGVGVDGAWM